MPGVIDRPFVCIAGGADATYIPETDTSVEVMQTDIVYLRKKFQAGFKKAVIVRNELCSRLYGMRFMQACMYVQRVRLLSFARSCLYPFMRELAGRCCMRFVMQCKKSTCHTKHTF